MNNFSQEPGRRVVTDAAGLNSFLTRMYGNMTLAVLVSAFSAYLTMGVFRSAVFGFFSAHPGMVWVILLLPIALSMGVSFSATRNPVGAFIMLMLTSLQLLLVFIREQALPQLSYHPQLFLSRWLCMGPLLNAT